MELERQGFPQSTATHPGSVKDVLIWCTSKKWLNTLDLPPHPGTDTTRIITFLVGNHENKPSFVTGILGGGVDQMNTVHGRNPFFNPVEWNNLPTRTGSPDFWSINPYEPPNSCEPRSKNPALLSMKYWVVQKRDPIMVPHITGLYFIPDIP